VESCCECGYEPSGSIKCWKLSSGYIIGGLLSSSQLHGVSYLYSVCVIWQFNLCSNHTKQLELIFIPFW
jgi:hypothetical protein